VTLLYIPDASQGIRTVRISHAAIMGIGILAAALIIGVGLVTVGYFTTVVDGVALNRLRTENVALAEQLNLLRSGLDDVRGDVAVLADLGRTIRLEADIDPMPAGMRNIGMGGGGPLDEKGATREPLLLTSIEMDDARSDLEKLMQEVHVQKDSFQEILTALERQSHLRSHTPSIRPTTGWISSRFGYRRDPFTDQWRWHRGVDISAPSGTPIIATADGVISYVGRRGGLGRVVEIDHGYEFSTLYGHCSVVRVRKGERVTRGQLIALVGKTGRTTGSHVHYEVMVSGTPVNPKNYFLPAGGT
jgi:hypothetical protein